MSVHSSPRFVRAVCRLYTCRDIKALEKRDGKILMRRLRHQGQSILRALCIQIVENECQKAHCFSWDEILQMRCEVFKDDDGGMITEREMMSSMCETVQQGTFCVHADTLWVAFWKT